MTIDDDAFARSLAALRPVKADIGPADLFYEAGFAAGATQARSSGPLLRRVAAVALIAAGLSAGGGFYLGHQKGERTGYLAAVAAPVDAPPEQEPAFDESRQKQTVEEPAEPAGPPDASPPADQVQPATPAERAPRLAASQSLPWQWILRHLDPQLTILGPERTAANSPLRIRPTEQQWEELVNLRHRPPVLPRPADERPADNQYLPNPDRPLTITPTKEWLQSITTY